MTNAKRVLGFDDFLNAPGDRAKGGSYLSGWKTEGKTTVWLHKRTWSARVWNHPIPMIIEFTDKETKEERQAIRTDRWGCHEVEELLMHRYDRDDDGRRQMPPTLCPGCLFPEVVRELVAKGDLDWTAPVMKWEAEEEDDLLIRAGGVYNAFNSKDVEKDRELLKQLRKAGIDRRSSWNQSMLVRLQWLFLLANDKQIDAGIVKTFESKGLGDKMKKAIKDEIRRNRQNPDLGNPSINPYPFEWTYDETKSFDDKYDVIALPQEKPSPEILKLIEGPIPDVDDDLAPGNCWWLLNELQSHWIAEYKFPWERVFGPAEKAGLMVPPSDSKEDAGVDEDEDVDAPEVGRGLEASAIEIVVVGPEHDVWFEGAKPDENVKGKRVELVAPEEDPTTQTPAATTDEIEAAKKLLIEWGAKEVVDVVACDHCEARMTSDAIDCDACGAQFDETGKLTGLRCLENKKHIVALEGDGPRFICGTCATIHELAPETPDLVGAARWTKIEKPKEEKKAAPAAPAAEPKRRRLGGETAAPPAVEEKKAAEPATRQRRGVPFDQPKAGK
jgi:hypothetical protein